MKFAIRVSSLGGVFVEEDGGREWGEYVLRVEAADEAAVYGTAEYREAQDLAEKIGDDGDDGDDPTPPTLEEAKASFDRCEGHRLGAQYDWGTGAELGAWRRDQIPAYEAPADLKSLHVEVWNRHNGVPYATFRPVVEGNRITGWRETWPGKK